MERSTPLEMGSVSEPRLISFCLFSYNQAHYIRRAIEGAFAQTYSPLEIILSDDCSPDGTFAVMEAMAAGYHGPHRLVLNRNPRNLGLGNHVNRLMELAQGEYVIIAAGDDISLPNRAESLYAAFRSSDNVMAAFSDLVEIDETESERGLVSSVPPDGFADPVEMCRHLFRGITGASAAWHRRVFDLFGPMLPTITFEDRVIPFRAALLGTIVHVPKPLVLYRRHGENTVAMFHSIFVDDVRKRAECFREVYRNNNADLGKFAEKFKTDRNARMIARCRSVIQRRIRKYDAYLQIHSGIPARMLAGMLKLVVNGGNPVAGLRQCVAVVRWRRSQTCR